LALSLTALLCTSCYAEKPAEQRAVRNWAAQKEALQDLLVKCYPACPQDLKARYASVTLAYEQALNVTLGFRPETAHPVICQKHGRVYMNDYEYMEFLASGPLQALNKALAHQVDARNPDVPDREFKIRCPICNRVARMDWK
jgi:hypothetical protein